LFSASKGLEEKDYDFDIEFYDEIDPAVRPSNVGCGVHPDINMLL
jgi:hypothetical protein